MPDRGGPHCSHVVACVAPDFPDAVSPDALLLPIPWRTLDRLPFRQPLDGFRSSVFPPIPMTNDVLYILRGESLPNLLNPHLPSIPDRTWLG